MSSQTRVCITRSQNKLKELCKSYQVQVSQVCKL